ncbi:zinc finger protein similar to Kruppel [Strongylocentrotus purpuratus]|uniref:C2H2-type domain-containing protein n=1 Tax=Strongylocentrotus purpuratus TaxID=7668 RepID=A0A7M6UQE2_STRPU|nr:zinc finger protein similar to Kruppel [Strongylocentrotus purpuratus]
MSPLPFSITSNRNDFDMDRLHAASSLLSLGSKGDLSPITIETQEPDFNKAIASVIWSRHRHETPSTIFKCGVPNCPLCPAGDACSTRLSGQECIQRSDQVTSKSSRRTSVVNWLISSSSPSTAPRSGNVSYGHVRTNSQPLPPYLASSQRSWPAPASLTGSAYSNSDTEGSRSSPGSSTSSPSYYHELTETLRRSPTVSASSPDISAMPTKRQRLDETSPNTSSNFTVERQLPFSCKFCPKRFTQASNCSSHQRTHTGARPFQCPSCPKAFAQRTSLRTHLRTHTGDRPYCCQDCQQRFGDLSTLTKHRRTHTGERPYRCQHEGCKRAFAQSGNLKRHYKTHLLDRQLERISV